MGGGRGPGGGVVPMRSASPRIRPHFLGSFGNFHGLLCTFVLVCASDFEFLADAAVLARRLKAGGSHDWLPHKNEEYKPTFFLRGIGSIIFGRAYDCGGERTRKTARDSGVRRYFAMTRVTACRQ